MKGQQRLAGGKTGGQWA